MKWLLVFLLAAVSAAEVSAQGPIRRLLFGPRYGWYEPGYSYTYTYPQVTGYTYTAPATYTYTSPAQLYQAPAQVQYSAGLSNIEVLDDDDQIVTSSTWDGPYIDGGVRYVIRPSDGTRFYWDGTRYHQRFFERNGTRYDSHASELRFRDGWRHPNFYIQHQAGRPGMRLPAGAGPHKK